MVLLRNMALCCAILWACGAPGPEPQLTGAHLAGDARALSRVLVDLEVLRDTPLARVAAELRARLEGCEHFAAHAETTADLAKSVECVRQGRLPEALRSLRGEADVVFSAPLGESARLSGTGSVEEDGSVRILSRVDPLPREGFAAFLMPASEPAGPPVLNASDALVHARLRPEMGLDLARFVSQQGQADTLFKLKSELFFGAVLSGTLEIASYTPRPGSAMAPLAAAADFSLRAPAVAAMERFVADLEATWPVQHRDVEIAGHTGACFFDFRILPEFAPCYVATDGALVLGWNPASIELALTGGPPPHAPSPVPARLVVDLAALPIADAFLRGATAPETFPAGAPVWKRLVVDARRSGGPVELEIALLAGSDS